VREQPALAIEPAAVATERAVGGALMATITGIAAGLRNTG